VDVALAARVSTWQAHGAITQVRSEARTTPVGLFGDLGTDVLAAAPRRTPATSRTRSRVHDGRGHARTWQQPRHGTKPLRSARAQQSAAPLSTAAAGAVMGMLRRGMLHTG